PQIISCPPCCTLIPYTTLFRSRPREIPPESSCPIILSAALVTIGEQRLTVDPNIAQVDTPLAAVPVKRNCVRQHRIESDERRVVHSILKWIELEAPFRNRLLRDLQCCLQVEL